MLTNEQKAGAWDGLKDAMIYTESSSISSCECKKMAREFLLTMKQIEDKTEMLQRINNEKKETTGTPVKKNSIKCLECTKHTYCKLPERKVALHQCKDFLRNSRAVLPYEPMADMIEDILNTLLIDNMIKDINTAWVSCYIVIEMSKRGVFVEL